MVQPSFSSGQAKEEDESSPTAVLDDFLDKQHQSYYEELYDSEAACLCLFR
jgi:transcription initiation factor TFIIH subunit 4